MRASLVSTDPLAREVGSKNALKDPLSYEMPSSLSSAT